MSGPWCRYGKDLVFTEHRVNPSLLEFGGRLPDGICEDDQREHHREFHTTLAASASAVPHFVIVLNSFDELKRLTRASTDAGVP